MVYNSSSSNNNNNNNKDNTLSALSFTSSTASATGASFASSDDPVGDSSGHSSLLVSWRKIFESVYRCDSAAVVDGTSTCGSVANQALYQGVEVVLKTTTSCGSAGNLKDSVKDSMASKPFFEYQCFCDDDDFVVNNSNEGEGEQQQQQQQHCTTPAHFRSSSCWSTGSGEDRNERNKDGVSSSNNNNNDDDVRNKPSENNEGRECCENEAVLVRRSKWEAHTKNFYSKINSPAPRVVTTLSDLNNNTVTTTTNQKKKNNAAVAAASNGMQSSSSPPLRCWIPNRTLVSESREEQE